MIACLQTTRRSELPGGRLARLTTGAALACLFFGASCKQEKILCTTAHGPFAVKYMRTSLTGTGTACGDLKAGLVGVESYDRGGPDQAPNFKNQPIALRPAEVGELLGQYNVSTIPTKMQSATGAFTDVRPGDDGFCHAGDLTAITLDLPMVPAMTDPMTMETTPALPAMKTEYKFTNVTFYVSPRLIGTQFTADLSYTKDGCTATYKVQGLYPPVGCEKTKTVLTCKLEEEEEGTGLPNDEACNPCSDPAHGRATGSGISPDLDVACDPETLFCMPKAAPPALRATSIVCGSTPAATPPAADGGGGAAVTPTPPVCLDAMEGEGGGGGGGADGGAAGDGPAGGGSDGGATADSATD